jgi:hypothetical protein
MIDWLVYLRGRWRIFWGFCPVCNSDASALDHCQFCYGGRGYRDKKARRDLRFRWMETNGKPTLWM